jgi:Spy/CpxP family protein refolding chaperone
MKSFTKIILPVFALAVGALAPLSLVAQPSGDRPARPERGGPGGPGGAGDRLAMLSEQLALTGEQKTKVQAVLESERAGLEALRNDTSLTQEARRDKMQANRQSSAAQIRALLTPDQQKKMGEMRGASGQRGPGGPGAGQKAQKGGEVKK